MRARTPICSLLVAAVLLATTAPALAQNAGENQYVDPLAGQHSSGSGGQGSSSGASGAGAGASAGTSAGVGAAASSGTANASPPSSTGTQASGQQGQQGRGIRLARTGFDAWIPALAGILLIFASVLLRRSARSEHR